MLDVNLYTLNFVRSTNEPDRLFLIEESTGDPVYFRLKVPQGTETRIELYHAPTLAPLGVFQNLSSKLKLVSLANPATTVELKNSGYINFEWTFYFDKILKFCWKKDIVGLAGSRRGFTCWMSRKPDPDYPCAIYKPGSSTVPPFCQFLDFNIRRIDGLQDPQGLKYVIMLSLLGFTEALADHEVYRNGPDSPPRSHKIAPPTTSNAPAEANELLISSHRSTSDLVAQGLKLFEDPLFLYLSVYASSPTEFQQAITVAEQIKRDRFKKSGEELQQYLVDDIISQEMTDSKLVPNPSRATSNTLRIYLSRTPLDELLPKWATKTYPGKSTKSSVLPPGSTRTPKSSNTKSPVKPQIPPKDQTQGLPTSSSSTSSTANSLHTRLLTGVHRPFSKIKSIASNPSRSSEYYENHITPYYFEEEEEEEEQEQEIKAEVMQVHDEKSQIETTQPLRLRKDRPVNSEIEYRPVVKYHNPPHSNPLLKKSEPFIICANELNKTNNPTPKNRVLVKKKSRNIGKEERRPTKLDLSSNQSDTSPSGSDGRNSEAISSSGESIRSRTSTIKSTASSFVEIVLSSCCSAYSSAFNGPEPSSLDRARRNLKNSPRNRTSPTTPTWKRLSHLGSRQSFVSNLFSSKLDTS